MTTEEYKNFSAAVMEPPKPKPEAAIAAVVTLERERSEPIRETVLTPAVTQKTERIVPQPVEPVK